jgi:heptosyltransferase II
VSVTAKRRVLIVKLGAIGDVVMVIPAAYALHRDGYEVDWLCGKSVLPLLALYPWIRTIAVQEEPLLRGSGMERMRAMRSLWKQMRGREYELCATLYYDSRYSTLTWPVRARRRLRLSWDDRARALLPGRRDTDEYVRILLGRKDDETPQQIAPVRPEGLAPCSLAGVDGRSRVVLVPGGAKNLLRDNPLRRWPLHNYVELALKLIEHGYEVVLAGGPDDMWAVSAFAGLDVRDAIGKLSLVESVSLLDSAAVTVTHDTGPLHLAGITSTAVVAIFGPTSPYRFMPQRENCVALWGGEGFACRPCYDGREFAPCSNNGCVQQVTVEMAFGEVERLLAAKRSGAALAPRVTVPERTPLVHLNDEARA